jgi:hypothetical protein
VSQLARAVRLSQSCTTRHLQALEAAGLVKGWRDGKRVVFRLEPRDEAAAAVIASLEAPPENEAGPLEAPVPPPRPRAKRRRPEPDPQEVRPPATEAPAREEPESGMNSAPPPAARYWSEIEDYLL